MDGQNDTPTTQPAPPRAIKAILCGGITVAVFDAVNATTFWALFRGTEPHVIFQSIAAGLLGPGAFSGGLATAWLGAFLHLFIACGIAAVYYVGCRIWPILLRRAVISGLIYGAVVYVVMNHVVVPLSQARPAPFNPAWFLDNLLGHLFLVGLPVALIARWSVPESRAVAKAGVMSATPAVLPLWQRVPVAVRAVLTGLLAATAGTLPWAVLVSANTRHWSAVPWAVPPTALYLWLYWRYLRGAGWPRSTAEARRRTCRANPLSEEVWGMALFAGVLGLVGVLLLQVVLSRMVTLPQQRDIDPSKYPLVTVTLWVLMSAVVAGVVEEASFRGYLQGPIERRHGPVIAILVTGSLFGFAHFTHPEVTLVLMPFYLGTAAVYGALAYLTDSILPGMLLHAGGNVLGAINLFAGGRSEWQAPSGPEPLIWETGSDLSFWISLVATLIVGAGAVWAYATLAGVARRAPDRMSPG